ncbi:MAG: AAA family ATPase, partial [Candidatus Omnitrophota bacterium]
MAKTIVLFSTKGGVGKTLIATNMAVSLAKDHAKRVLVVDLDLQVVGDMARMLDLEPQKALVDWINLLKKQPEGLKKDNFIVKSPLGLDFLTGVLRPQQSPHLDADSLKAVFAELDKDYDYIIIDAGQSFSDVFLAVLNQANLMLLVVTPDILSIYQTKWTLDTLQFLHFPLKMIKIVLNRAESASSISWQEVRVSLPAEIICLIPSEGKIAGLAVNRGIPMVIDNPRTKISLAIKKFSQKLATDEGLFIPHKDIDEIRLKEATIEKPQAFWQSQGLTEQLAEPQELEQADEIVLLKQRIHNKLIESLNLKRLDLKIFTDRNKTKALKDKAEIMVANFLAEEAGSFIPSQEV